MADACERWLIINMVGGPGRTRTCNQTVMSCRRSISFVDSAAALFDFDHVRCVSISLFLVRTGAVARKLGLHQSSTSDGA
jgi:hypothetical protein